MKEDLISLVIPVYNAKRYLPRCIRNLQEQTWKNFEIILVDDGSTDGSKEICDELAKQKSIKVIHKKNGGAFLARKAGVNIAMGKYVGFVDADDYIEPQMYSVLHTAAQEYDSDCVICDFYAQSGPFKIKISNSANPGYYDRTRIEKEILPTIIYDKQNGKDPIISSVCVKLFRTSLLRQVLAPVNVPLRYGEDHYQTVAFFMCTQSCCILDRQFLYHYIVHPHSTMTSYKKGYLENILLLHEEFRKLSSCVPECHLEEQIDAHLCQELCSIILDNGKLRTSWKRHRQFVSELYNDTKLRQYMKPELYRKYNPFRRTAGWLFFSKRHNLLTTWLWIQGLFRPSAPQSQTNHTTIE